MNTGAVAAPAIVSNERIGRDRFTGATVANTHFRNCDFSGADLTGTTFVNCVFYDADTQAGCRFNGAQLKEARFRQCDLSMCGFAFAKALGLEIVECRAQGADFSNASFMNQITARSWFCSAVIRQSNLAYADFSGVTLEKMRTAGQPLDRRQRGRCELQRFGHVRRGFLVAGLAFGQLHPLRPERLGTGRPGPARGRP